jgi:transposase
MSQIRYFLLGGKPKRKEEKVHARRKELGEQMRDTVNAVCCDMWAPYIGVIKRFLPKALLVFDKFHIVRHLMDAVDEIRKEEARKLKDKGTELLKDTKYIWLKNPWNLTEHQKVRFSDLERLNLKTHRAYLLKQAFRRFWDYTYPAWAEKYLRQWFWRATHSWLEPMRKFAWMIREHQEEDPHARYRPNQC